MIWLFCQSSENPAPFLKFRYGVVFIFFTIRMFCQCAKKASSVFLLVTSEKSKSASMQSSSQPRKNPIMNKKNHVIILCYFIPNHFDSPPCGLTAFPASLGTEGFNFLLFPLGPRTNHRYCHYGRHFFH